MAKSKNVTVPLSARQCNLLEDLVDRSLAHMAHALTHAKTPAEAQFYRTQPDKIRPLKALFADAAKKGERAPQSRKVKMPGEYLVMMLGLLRPRKLEAVSALSTMPEGEERTALLALDGEWDALDILLDKYDPRYHDHSQDAEEDEDEGTGD